MYAGSKICTSWSMALTSNSSSTKIVHSQTVISAFLIVALLPITSLAAVCNVNCEMQDRHVNHPASSNAAPSQIPAQHHHSSSEITSTNNTSLQAGLHGVSSGHGCCNDSGRKLSSVCQSQLNSVKQEQAGSPEFQPDSFLP